MSRQVSTAALQSKEDLNESRKLHEEDRSNGRVPLETNQANLGTVSEMSKSVNEFDFSSIEEFPADED